MSWGMRILASDGSVEMNTDTFGYILHDTFTVAPTATGNKSYPELDWFHELWGMQTQDVSGNTSLAIAQSFNSMSMSATVDPTTNIPTLYWSPDKQVGTSYNVRIYVLVA